MSSAGQGEGTADRAQSVDGVSMRPDDRMTPELLAEIQRTAAEWAASEEGRRALKDALNNAATASYLMGIGPPTSEGLRIQERQRQEAITELADRLNIADNRALAEFLYGLQGAIGSLDREASWNRPIGPRRL